MLNKIFFTFIWILLFVSQSYSSDAYRSSIPRIPASNDTDSVTIGVRVATTQIPKANNVLGNLLILPGEPELRFDKALQNGPYPVMGKSIKELSSGSALFGPIDGLSASTWEAKSCGECHKWEQKSLCEQGEFYGSQTPDTLLRKKHPYGGPFKLALREWSLSGCH